jgi:hypothetical protein
MKSILVHKSQELSYGTDGIGSQKKLIVNNLVGIKYLGKN